MHAASLHTAACRDRRQLTLGESFGRSLALRTLASESDLFTNQSSKEHDMAQDKTLAALQWYSRSRSPALRPAPALDVTAYERTWPRPRVQCPECGGTMVLRWGNERKPHFAHLHNSSTVRGCDGGESIEHRLTKLLLARHLNAQRSISFRYACGRCLRNVCHTIGSSANLGCVAETEFALASGARADVFVMCPGNKPIAVIEVLFTHRASTAIRTECPWFEVAADEVLHAFKSDLNIDVIELQCQRQDRGTCGHALCLSTYDIAKQLDYHCLKDWYTNENDRERDAAMRGKFVCPKWLWQVRCWGIISHLEPEEERTLWCEFVRRRHCIRCQCPWDVKPRKPFCLNCYRLTYKEADEYDRDVHAWQVVEKDEKQRLRQKYKWLEQFDHVTPDNYSCQVCEKDIDFGNYTWWFGKRQLCDDCFKSWTPSKTQQYVNMVRRKRCGDLTNIV